MQFVKLYQQLANAYPSVLADLILSYAVPDLPQINALQDVRKLYVTMRPAITWQLLFERFIKLWKHDTARGMYAAIYLLEDGFLFDVLETAVDYGVANIPAYFWGTLAKGYIVDINCVSLYLAELTPELMRDISFDEFQTVVERKLSSNDYLNIYPEAGNENKRKLYRGMIIPRLRAKLLATYHQMHAEKE